MFVDNHNRAGHAKPQQCTAARMVAHEKPTAPGGRRNKAAPARPVLLPRVVSPPRRMLHTDAAAVWRRYRREQEKQHHRRGRGQYRHTDKSPARMGAPAPRGGYTIQAPKYGQRGQYGQRPKENAPPRIVQQAANAPKPQHCKRAQSTTRPKEIHEEGAGYFVRLKRRRTEEAKANEQARG